MAPALTDDALIETCRRLRDEGAIGVLLSGGSARDGSILNLRERVEAIRRVKAETGLLLNIHPGLMDEATAGALAPVLDFVSLEIPSTAAIHSVFGLNATTEDYVATYHRLRSAGMHVVPHVAVYDGTEAWLLEPLAGVPHPETIVVIIFAPTRGTPMAEAAPPTPAMVGNVIGRISGMFPDTEIALGCMRPRGKELRVALELAALDAGATRMELPSRSTLEIAQSRGYGVVQYDTCCALPRTLEEQAMREHRLRTTLL
jgi:hypothetical protein